MSGLISLHPAPCLVRCEIYENTIALAMSLKQCAQRNTCLDDFCCDQGVRVRHILYE